MTFITLEVVVLGIFIIILTTKNKCEIQWRAKEVLKLWEKKTLDIYTYWAIQASEKALY